VKKYTFNLICSHPDKKCKYRRIERYMPYCSDYRKKIVCDNAVKKNEFISESKKENTTL